jgi:pseudaminic acid cytidylyltransferase
LINCIIPARGGSKRIPYKNIREFCGVPIIAYPIRSALQSGLFDNVIVSTDDPKIAKVAQHWGSKLHWRSEKNSDDHAMLADVLEEVISESPCDIVCCLLPCTPLVRYETLRKAWSLLKTHNAVVPVVQYSQPYRRALYIDDDNVAMIDPSMYNVRSQDLAPVYYDPGCFWFLKVPAFMEHKMLYPPDSMPFVMDEAQTQDIDTEEDWEMLRLKFKRKLSSANQMQMLIKRVSFWVYWSAGCGRGL